MTCPAADEDDLLARYVAHELDDAEEEAFEVHLLRCPQCTASFEALVDARAALRAAGPVRKPTAAPPWIWPLAATALLALGIGGLWRQSSHDPVSGSPAPSAAPMLSSAKESPLAPPSTAPSPVSSADESTMAQLASISAPEYLPLTARGAAPTAFDGAMLLYAGGRYGEAAKALEQLPTHDSRSEFFRGVALLLAGRTADARTLLEVQARGGDADYGPASRFFLAKAHLRAGRTADARRELVLVASSESSYADEARGLLARIARLDAR